MVKIQKLFSVAMSTFLFCSLASRSAYSEDWKASCETSFPPYNYLEDGKHVGMDTELVQLVMKSLEGKGIKMAIEDKPWARVVKELEEGQKDFAWQFIDSPERREKFTLVGPLRDGTTVFMVKKDSPIQEWKSLEDFKGKKIGVVNEFKYTPEFDADTKIVKEASNNNSLLVPKLEAGRLDAVIGDKNTLIYEAKKGKVFDKFRILEKPVKVVPRFVAFNKKEAAKAKVFEEALNKAKETKDYKDIIEKYSSK